MAFLDYHFYSHALGKQTSAYVLLPEATKGRFPVLYLLHGLSDDHTMWLRLSSIERYAANLPVIIVMPDGGRGFYADAVEGFAYGKAIGEELVDRIDHTFPTQPNRKGRVLAGLSMGGYGAVRLALAYPKRFRAAHSLSGSMTFGSPLYKGRDEAFIKEFSRVLGPNYVGGPNDLFALAEKRSRERALPQIRFDCGVDDYFMEHNRAFAKHLTEKRIRHEFNELPGAHNWEFWNAHVPDALRFLFPRLASRVLP